MLSKPISAPVRFQKIWALNYDYMTCRVRLLWALVSFPDRQFRGGMGTRPPVHGGGWQGRRAPGRGQASKYSEEGVNLTFPEVFRIN